jgi:hypothetical protein
MCRPIRYNTDQVNYRLNIRTLPSQYSYINRNQNYEYKLNVKNGLLIDVSAAVIFNYKLRDDVPIVEPITPTSSIITRGNKNNLLVPTYGVLLNAYRRSYRDYNFVLNLGTATNGSNLFYYLGGGLLFGKEERLGLSAGLVGSLVQQLNSPYQFDVVYQEPIGELANKQLLYPSKQFRYGYYFGFTYNLKGKNSDRLSLSPSAGN